MIFYVTAVNFWVMFGGEQQTAANLTDPSPDLFHFHRVAVMLFRMSLIDSYPYEVRYQTLWCFTVLFTIVLLIKRPLEKLMN